MACRGGCNRGLGRGGRVRDGDREADAGAAECRAGREPESGGSPAGRRQGPRASRGTQLRDAGRRRGGRARGAPPPTYTQPRGRAGALPPGRRRAERPPEHPRAEVTPTRRAALAFAALAVAAPFVPSWLILLAAGALVSARIADALL